jgi:predicted Zn-ribbon and HTH transcriptional regulator
MGFESDIFNYKNKNYKKFMKKDKKEKLNNSVDYSELRSRKVKGNCKWPADMNWTKNSELVFKTHIKNLHKNKNMSSFDRFHVDNVKNLIENVDEKDIQNKKIRRNRSDLGLGRNDIKRPIFEKDKYNISRTKKLSNNFSVLDNEKTYRNNFKIKNSGKKLDEKEYIIDKPGNMDIIEFSKLMKAKGIHLIDVKEKADIIENENKDNKDRIIHFKIREDINDKKNNNDLKKIEKILKKNNKQLEIKPAPKKKGYGLKEIDFYDKRKNWK